MKQSHFRRPQKVGVVGAGVAGLSTAFFLQEHGIEVEVLDRTSVGAGASSGNTGWISPGLSEPLPSPALLKAGIKGAANPDVPVYLPSKLSADTVCFLAGFALNSRSSAWKRGLQDMVHLNEQAINAYEAILASEPLRDWSYRRSPMTIGFTSTQKSEEYAEGLRKAQRLGQPVVFDYLDGSRPGSSESALGPTVAAGIEVNDQAYVDPQNFLNSLSATIVERGGKVRIGTNVLGIDSADGSVRLRVDGQRDLDYDAVVLANGTWFNEFRRDLGVRSVVQAGRGYSFKAPMDELPNGPLYFPSQKIACTPLGGYLRVAGVMEFDIPDAPMRPDRMDVLANSVAKLLPGLDVAARTDEWVGSRPCTTDGLPLIGRSRTTNVYVANGLGMYGMTHGPVTGRLLAEYIDSGYAPPALIPMDPTR